MSSDTATQAEMSLPQGGSSLTAARVSVILAMGAGFVLWLLAKHSVLIHLR